MLKLYDVLRDLISFVQFKKYKNTHGGMSLLKSCTVTLILLDGCF